MDRKGFELISRALQDENIAGVTVLPEPAEGQRLEYVTLETDPPVAPAHILNALGRAGLLERTGASDVGWRSGPALKPLFGQTGNTTFVDTNNRN